MKFWFWFNLKTLLWKKLHYFIKPNFETDENNYRNGLHLKMQNRYNAVYTQKDINSHN